MNYRLLLVLFFSSAIPLNLVSNGWVRQRILDKYADGKTGQSPVPEDEREDFSKDEKPTYSEFDIDDNDNIEEDDNTTSEVDQYISDDSTRESFIRNRFTSKNIAIDSSDYAIMTQATTYFTKREISNLIKSSIDEGNGDISKTLEAFYLGILLRRKNIAPHDIALPDLYLKPYIGYLNKQYDLKLTHEFINKTFTESGLTLDEIESIFFEAYLRISDLKPDQTHEQVVIDEFVKILINRLEKANATTQSEKIKIGEKSKIIFEKSNINFSNIATEVPSIASTIALAWKNKDLLTSKKIELPNSLLLHGEPGTGKTLLAQAIAGEINAYFHQAISSTLIKKYYGESVELVANMFDDAVTIVEATNNPVVVFLDEIDSIASESKESARTDVLQKLHEILDRPRYKNKILLISATNKIAKLAETFLSRSASNIIYMTTPDSKSRMKLIEKFGTHFSVQLDSKFLVRFAKQTDKFSHREIEALFKQAVLFSAVEKNPQTTTIHLERALKTKLKEKETIKAFTNRDKWQTEADDFRRSFKNSLINAAMSAAATGIFGITCFICKKVMDKYYPNNQQQDNGRAIS